MALDETQESFPARRILFGVSGSIGAVVVPQCIFLLRQVLGLEVRAALTRQAATLVAPRAVAVASGHPVALDANGADHDPAVTHIELTRWADLLLVLPATANVLAKAALGVADDLLSTCVLAARCPVVFVPNMNEAMWRKPALQRNIATLEADGHLVIKPVEGLAAVDGQLGDGVMPDIRAVLRGTRSFLLRRQQETSASDNEPVTT
jgi:phosphopantothenoylcysteine decarboxylase/phosphopantothenate--cysteine ligase